jgi:hypothetical protein
MEDGCKASNRVLNRAEFGRERLDGGDDEAARLSWASADETRKSYVVLAVRPVSVIECEVTRTDEEDAVP